MKKVILLLALFTLFTSSTLSQWYRQTVPVTNSITGIEFVDSLRGWACTEWNVGSTGYIISTTNGGINWVIQFSLAGNKFTALDMIDGNTGYVTGWNLTPGDAFVYKTTNGGLNWFNLNAAIGVDADDIFFVNAQSGYLCADFSINVYKTTNGGLNWFLSNNGIIQHPYRLFFLNYNTGFCGADFVLYKTTDAGASWAQISSFSETVKSIFFLNENTGWLGFGNNSIIRKTTNGGANWVFQSNPGFSNVSDIYFYNDLLGWAGTGSIYVYKTTNGGELWGYQRDSTGCHNISFIDSSRGWSGDAGISRTINGGGVIIYVGIININNQIPEGYILYQNYPNPFNSQTNIKFSITKKSYINFKIYDVQGREKNIWQSNRLLEAGTYEFKFDAQDLASGLYFYRIIAKDNESNVLFNETKKMILIK